MVAALLAVLVPAGAAHAKSTKQPQHVFVIVLENQDADTTFGPASSAPYLAQTLTAQGAFVPGYYGIGHHSLDNYIAMVSGQAPNVETQADCQLFTDFLPGTPTSDGQVIGQGCVYPASVKTIADQLESRGLSWKGYMEDMGADPVRDNGTTCAHRFAVGHASWMDGVVLPGTSLPHEFSTRGVMPPVERLSLP